MEVLFEEPLLDWSQGNRPGNFTLLGKYGRGLRYDPG